MTQPCSSLRLAVKALYQIKICRFLPQTRSLFSFFLVSFLFFCPDDLDAYATKWSVDVRDLGVRSRVAFREEVCGLQLCQDANIQLWSAPSSERAALPGRMEAVERRNSG